MLEIREKNVKGQSAEPVLMTIFKCQPIFSLMCHPDCCTFPTFAFGIQRLLLLDYASKLIIWHFMRCIK